MSKRNIEAIYQLSPVQQGMLFHSLIAPESGVYVEQMHCALQGALNLTAFEEAWRQALDRHASLRACFVWEKLDQMLQVTQRRVELPFERYDWRALPEAEREARLDAFLAEDRARGFDISRAPLLRLALFRLGEDDYRFVFSHHHALLDGWSTPLLFQEVFAFYEAFSRGETPSLAPVRHYRDYIAWRQKQDTSEAESYWRKALAGFAAPTPLAPLAEYRSMREAPTEGEYAEGNYEAREIRLSEHTTGALQTLARKRQLTLNTLMQGAWALLLSRYSGEDDVVFGATVSGRPADLAGVETMIGNFINTLPVRAKVYPDASILTWLKELQTRQAEMRQYEYSSLVQVQGWSEVPRGTALFDSILVFENYPVDISLREVEFSLKVSDVCVRSQTNYPLTVVGAPGRELRLKVLYDIRRFDAGAVERMLGHLRALLEGIAADTVQRLSQLQLLTDDERRRMLIEWNDTAAPYPSDCCVHQLFEAQVDRTPNAVAVEFDGQSLSYRELNERANQLAHYLRKLGVGPGALVGLCVERSPEMIVGLLGALKAGAAYVPMDPAYPAERLRYMLEDTRTPIALTQSSLIGSLPKSDARAVCLDADWNSIAQESRENPRSVTKADDLAYVIYTSGSTGRPKGVMIEHRGLCNFADAQIRELEIKVGDRMLQFASLSFDASVSEIFTALLSGAALCLARHEELISMSDLARLIREREISMAILPPSALNQLPADELPSLRVVISAGESCARQIAGRWARGRRFYNAYGPTEATIGMTLYLAGNDLAKPDTVPIGRPIANTRAYILNAEGQPAPVGAPGELHIGGVGLARGYLNKPELTAEKFIEAQIADEPIRLYKTGDLCRFLPDGNIEFLGRIDQQVKIRGYRVELGEIEARLRERADVREAVVAAREDGGGDRRLVAYIVPEHESAPSGSELKSYLRERLPDYMTPSLYVTLDAIPLTSNGKVDRRALPAPEGVRPGLENEYVAPRTPAEDLLCGIWAQTLGLDRIGVHDDFFDLGGHSLLATQLVSRVRDAFAVDLPLRSLFEHPTVAGMAPEIEALSQEVTGASAPPIEPVGRDGDLRLSFSQQRLWFLDQLEPGSAAYNNPLAMRAQGPLNIEVLRQSLNHLIRRHEILRTSFAMVDGQPVQIIAPSLEAPIMISDLRHLAEPAALDEARRLVAEELQRPFDLATGPLIRVRLLRLADEDHVMALVTHHIISDGWSVGVLIRELAILYQAEREGAPSPLAELPLQYADYAEWQRRRLEGERLERQIEYWRKQLGSGGQALALPTDRPRPAVQTDRGAQETFFLPGKLVESLARLSRRENVTLFMTLMAAFQALLHRYTGQTEINVGTPIANRCRSELEGLIGFFANTLVMRADLSGDPSFRDFLKQTRETALGAYAHQDLPFEQLVEALQPQRDLSHSPLFQVMFMLHTASIPLGSLGSLGQTLDVAGLEFSLFEVENRLARFDLTLELIERPEGLGGVLIYNSDLFDATTIRRMIAHFQRLLEGVVADPSQRVSQLPVLTEAERRQILVEWNETAAEFPADRCFHHLFEERVAAQPDQVAASFEGQRLTYRELNERANQLAHYLRKQGVGPETIVGLCVERSLEMVIAQLGVMKAGAAYLPLDPNYPVERLAFMFEDSGAPVLLTQTHLAERSPRPSARVIELDREWERIAAESETNPGVEVGPENLAYVIYTSGSTGRPKGTLLEHRGLCNLAAAQQGAFNLGAGKRVLQFSPFSFDASVWEMAMALGSGAELVLARQETLASLDDLRELLQRERITIVTLPPSVLRLAPDDDLPDLETVIAAGERCTREIVARWGRGRRFFNAYGPTETTVCATMELCHEGDDGDPPIGRPLPNTQLFVLDNQRRPVPVGVPGELYVGGTPLARGYLRRPEMTAAAFVELQITDRPMRLYRTGDLVRYRADGRIEYLGRIDEQVKIRGHRIELGEVEAALREYPEISEASVAAIEDATGDKRLVGYFVSANGAAPTAAQLREHLRQRLPEFMTPSSFVKLERLPLSPSGKVDRAALPRPDGSRSALEREYVAPRTETEWRLAALWVELLSVERVGIEDNFFELGGHSLLATQFVSRVRETMQIELPLRALFEAPNLAALAEHVEKMRQAAASEAYEIARMLTQLEMMSEEQAREIVSSSD